MCNKILLVDRDILVDKSMIGDDTHMIKYDHNSDKSVIVELFEKILLDFELVESLGIIFHGKNDIMMIADNTYFFTVDKNKNVTANDEIINMFKTLVDQKGLKNIDFLGCNLASFGIWEKYFSILEKEIKITIGASTNNVGNIENNGNWILNISNRDCKQIYFNDNIYRLEQVFGDYTVTGDANDVAFFTFTPELTGGATYTLTGNVTIEINNVTGYVPIIILESSIFDGNDKTITVRLSAAYSDKPSYKFKGLFDIQNGEVKNVKLEIDKTNGDIILEDKKGWICAGKDNEIEDLFEYKVKLTNCTSNGVIFGIGSGGIIGSSAGRNGECIITSCSTSGEIHGKLAGGITGDNAGLLGKCDIINCSSSGNISGEDAGGITGEKGGTQGKCNIISCSSTGQISGEDAGGIAGDETGTGGMCDIINCSSSGEISGKNAGGISGDRAGEKYGICNIKNCTSSGKISGNNAGGIVGEDSGNAGECNIINCSSSGEISGEEAGGIAGGDAGQKGLCNITNCTTCGNISGMNTGGIVGSEVGIDDGMCNITNCTTYGAILGDNSGGICGSGVRNCVITKCMAIGSYDSSNSNIGSILGNDCGASDDNELVKISECFYRGSRLYGMTEKYITDDNNYECETSNMKGILLYTPDVYPNIGNEYYNIHGVGIADKDNMYGLNIEKINMTTNNIHPLSGEPVPENMAIAYATNSGKTSTVLKFTLGNFPPDGIKMRFCIPNADTSAEYGVYDIDDKKLGLSLTKDENSNVYEWETKFTSGRNSSNIGNRDINVFFVRNTTPLIEGGGDPHITTIDGKNYKLDNEIVEINLLTDRENDIKIDASCDNLKLGKFKMRLYSNDRYVSLLRLGFVLKNTYFTNFVIRCKTSKIIIDADTLEIKCLTNDDTFIKYNHTKQNKFYSITNKKLYPYTNDTKSVEIWIDGKTQLIITSDVNTDERHYISLTLPHHTDSQKNLLTGAFIGNNEQNVIKRRQKNIRGKIRKVRS